METTMSFMTWTWKSHSILSVVSWWLHKLAQLSVGEEVRGCEYQEAWIIGSHFRSCLIHLI